MEKSKTQKVSSLIFLPAIWLSLLLAGSSFLFHLAQNILMGQMQNVAQIQALKVSVIFPQIVFVLTLLIIAKHKPFEQVFRSTLIALIGIISLLTALVFFQEHVQMEGISGILKNFMSNPMLQIYEPIIKNWPVSLLYIALNLLGLNVFSLLIWGFINRFTTLSEGIKYYIPLAFVLGLSGTLVTNLGTLLRSTSDWPLIDLMIIAIALMTLALIIFNRAWKRLPDNFTHPEEPQIVSKNRFPFLTGAYLLAGSLMVEHVLTMLFKYQVKMQFSDASAYGKFMINYSISLSSSTIVVSILWAAFGTWLILKKGWRTTALFGFLSILIGGLAFLYFSATDQSVPWLSQGIFTGLLKSTTSALFFPLIQIVYLYMPYQTRFRTKIITEMIGLPLMKGIPTLLIQGLIIIFGSMSIISIYLKILMPILLVFLVIASRRISSRLTIGLS